MRRLRKTPSPHSTPKSFEVADDGRSWIVGVDRRDLIPVNQSRPRGLPAPERRRTASEGERVTPLDAFALTALFCAALVYLALR